MKSEQSDKPHVIVIGGGFAGVNFLRELFGSHAYKVTLIDKNNYNYFTPLLYQVATSFLEPSAISYPFRKLLENKMIEFRMGSLQYVDGKNNLVCLNDGAKLGYDILVIAAGGRTNFYGNKSLRKNAFAIKGIDDALYLRNELIKTLEKASVEEDLLEKKKLLTVVIAGGGPTGVELAGVFAELKNSILHMDYPELKSFPMTIYLIEASANLLNPMSDKTHKEALKAIEELGVDVKLNTRVNCYGDDMLLLSNGEIIETKTVIWAAGVTANIFEGIAMDSIGKGNRLITDRYNKVKGYSNIYAIGDISIQFTDKRFENGHPQLAQPAIQQGRTLAKNLLRIARGKKMKPFRYYNRGDMAIIGRKWAVADIARPRIHIHGFLGILGWLFIHLISLINYNNRVKTLYNWLVVYLTHDQVLRMIFEPLNREGGQRISKKKIKSKKSSLLH